MQVSNIFGLPTPFVEACKSDYEPTPKRYSVTTILGGLTKAVLQRRHFHELSEDASESVWKIFGQAVHKILEESPHSEHEEVENFLTLDMPGGYTMSGRFDLYDSERQTVVDYKTCSVYKLLYHEFDDWAAQVAAYCLMLRANGKPCDSGQIVAIIKDHSKAKAKFESNYPEHPVAVIDFHFDEDQLAYYEQLFKDSFEVLRHLEKLADDELPPCDPEARWATPTKYAVMKKGRKRAIKLYDDKADADIHAVQVGGYVETREGTDRKCTDYCGVCQWCRYWQDRYGGDSDADE